tara:strand:- start:211 stop:570 length:360 start_codon:yes stop_codon:yes gene_type:complete
MEETLYSRLGGAENITKIANDLVENHINNPAISTRFAEVDTVKLKLLADTFITSGTGGPNVYKGRDMLSTHKGMNISAVEFMAVLDDALKALSDNGVGQREQEEMLFILYSMRSEIVLV